MYFVKFEDTDYYSTPEFHSDRDAVAHDKEEGHIPRLERAAQWVDGLVRANPEYTVIDYGAGSGSLLRLSKAEQIKGYDFCPANVKYAQDHGQNVQFLDFVSTPREFSNVAVLLECAEHLLSPKEFLESLQAEWLVMSIPNGETQESHYFAHTHGADTEGCRELLLKASGWNPVMMENIWGTQLWLAMR